jgi:hypothetical protein
MGRGRRYHIVPLSEWQEISVQGLDKINIVLNNINVMLDLVEDRVNYLDGRRPVRHRWGAR